MGPFASRGSSLSTNGDIINNNSDGQVVVSDNFAFRDTGDSWLRLRNGPSSDTYADLALANLWSANCRICLNYSDGGSSSRGNYACVKMQPGNKSGRFTMRGDVDDNDTLEMVFLCDGGGNSANTGWVGY